MISTGSGGHTDTVSRSRSDPLITSALTCNLRISVYIVTAAGYSRFPDGRPPQCGDGSLLDGNSAGYTHTNTHTQLRSSTN